MPEQVRHWRDIQRCSRCGACMAVCPVYQATGEEGRVARGRLSLIGARIEKQLPLSPRFFELVDSCLLCGACSHHCPNQVEAHKLVQWQRTLFKREGALPLPRSLALRALDAAGRWPQVTARAASLAQALVGGKISADSGLHWRYPLQLLRKRAYLPAVAEAPFLLTAPTEIGTGQRVGLFVGCAGNFLFPEISIASVELLEACGFQVIIPPEQQCCGMAAWAAGDLRRARRLAAHNANLFLHAGCDWIVSACGTCSTQLRHQIPALLRGSAPEAAGFMAARSRDLVAFLLQQEPAAKIRQALRSPGPLRLAYHDPCHLLLHQGIYQEPRHLAALLPGVALIDPPGAPRCCGHGGMFNLSYYDLSIQIAHRSFERYAAVDPEVIATGCMGCLLQLRDASHRRGQTIKIHHLVEVLRGKVV